MVSLIRTDSDSPDFIELVRQLDAYLTEIDGSEHAFYAQLNKIDKIRHVVVAYKDGRPVGCGAIREYEPRAMEVKRMYTVSLSRGKGIAGSILAELENWAAEMSYAKCILETGKRQQPAIDLYERSGYRLIPNFGKYEGVENSVCFEKEIKTER